MQSPLQGAKAALVDEVARGASMVPPSAIAAPRRLFSATPNVLGSADTNTGPMSLAGR